MIVSIGAPELDTKSGLTGRTPECDLSHYLYLSRGCPDVRRGSPDPAGVRDRRSPALTVGLGFTGILAVRT
jgi:hypothetical protein